MKKLLPSILSAIIMLSFTAVCRAHTIEDTYKGISYVLSDNWVCDANEDSSTSFYHASNRNETISLNIIAHMGRFSSLYDISACPGALKAD